MTRNIMTIAGREFRSYFDQATAYILVVVFLVANFFFYFRTVFVTAEATLRPMFELMPWLLLFFVPAVTMRSLAEERSKGTLELVLAQPISTFQFLLGKYAGIMGFMAVALAGTLGAAVGLRLGGQPYFGVMFAQYAGALLLTGTLVAIGLWASSLTRNQITAFIVALASIFVLLAVTMNVVLIGLPPVLAVAATRLGLLTHFSAITRGVLDLRDIVYFISMTAAFLGLAYLMIERGRLNLRGASWRTLKAGILGILLICVVVNLLGRHIRGRLDLTPGKAYTLSATTRDVLRNVDDLVTIKLFASRELPPQVDLVKRDVEDLLADYQSAAGANLQLLRYSPSAADPDAEAEAERMQIPAIQFNVLGQEEFQVRQGYLGIAIQYADQTANVPFVRQTDDLEYRLTSAIMALTNPERTTVGFLTGHGEADIEGEASGLAETLRQNYQVTSVNITADSSNVADSIRVLVIQGPQTPLSEAEGEKLEAFLAGGGNMLLMTQPTAIDETQMFPSPQPHPVLDSLLAGYGVAIPEGMVMDLRSSGRVTLPSSSGMSYVVPYPLWPIVLPATSNAIVEGLNGVLLPWASPLDLSGADTTTVTPLLATTEFAQHLTGYHPINPQFDWRSIATDLRPQPMAAAILPRAGEPEGAGGGSPSGGRLVLVGDADFASNRFLGGEPGNLLFLTNAVDWLAQDESLIEIRSKLRRAPPLLYASEGVRDAAKYGNLIGVPFLFVLIGVLRLARRKQLQGMTYGKSSGPGPTKDEARA
ncbi:MAG: Gldg family protein [Candidatus Palauibacterales bacterium]|nr:Gldg family protein [Candidatus Palauibacterales bacterium]MDP2483105.1 Gldg family protein [Candidatus Palauibacterales bacterium]